MKPDLSDSDPRDLWQGQQTEHRPMSLAAIHERSRAFQAKIRWRNLLEYAASVVVIAGFIPALFDRHSWMMQIGGALTIVGTLFVAWQIHRRASARVPPEIGEPVIDFHRAELVRQRDAVGSVAVWYLAPLVPGLALLLLGRWLQAPAPHRSLAADHLIILVVAAIAVCVFLAIWLLNRRAAALLQRQIDELEASAGSQGRDPAPPA